MTKTSLDSAMKKAAWRMPHFGRTEAPLAPPQSTASNGQAPPAQPEATPKSQRAPSRIGKKVVSGYFDPEVSKQLARLGIDQERSNEDLLREALNDLFAKYRLPPIA